MAPLDGTNHKWLPEGASAGSATISREDYDAADPEGGWVTVREADGTEKRVWMLPRVPASE